MKTKLLLSVTVLFLLSAILAQAVVRTPDPAFDVQPEGTLTKSTWYQGELIPVVDLPEVEITGSMKKDHVIGAIIREDEIVILANLPEVEIKALKTINQKYKAILKDGEVMVVTDLPLVEITSSFPESNLVPAFRNGSTNDLVLVVWLPELVVTGTDDRLQSHAAGFYPDVKPMVPQGSLQESLLPGFGLASVQEKGKQPLYCTRPLPAYILIIPQNL